MKYKNSTVGIVRNAAHLATEQGGTVHLHISEAFAHWESHLRSLPDIADDCIGIVSTVRANLAAIGFTF